MSKPKAPPPPGRSADDDGAIEAALLLNGRQLAFCHHYVRTGDARKAYLAAYGRPGTGTAQLNHPLVRSEILRLQALVAREVVLDRAWILEKMMKLAQIALGELPHVTETLDENGEVISRIAIRAPMMSEARQLLTQLGKVDEIGLFVERQEVRHEFDFATMTDDELQQLVIDVQANPEPPQKA